jgi:hypothetical protein
MFYLSFMTRLVVTSGSVQITPQIGPVANVRIGNQDGEFDVSHVGMTPLVTFDNPSIGTLTRCTVTIYRVAVRGLRE